MFATQAQDSELHRNTRIYRLAGWNMPITPVQLVQLGWAERSEFLKLILLVY